MYILSDVHISIPVHLLLPAPGFLSEYELRRVAGEARRLLLRHRVPPSGHGVVAHYLLSDSVRRELYPAGQARENSFEEFKKRFLGTYGPKEST
ncbi:hypothetical protein T01_7196 [Trichinella spiralis]|uniref:Uncharacterized protein n=1 Tax=Trichinella spiralis TaxID=6334 RepID=A0A0V1BJ75_TRISP|nr:hypothetical protein T01_7196 [Trichinella spiralis]